MSSRCRPLPIRLDHRCRYVARITKRCRAARSRICAATTARAAVSSGVIGACARPPACMILVSAGLHDNGRDGGGGQHNLSLALGVRLRGFGRWVGLGERCRTRDWRGCLSGRAGKGHWRGQHGRWGHHGDSWNTYRRALMAHRIGRKRCDRQKNQYRPAPHRRIRADAGSARKVW